MIASNYIERRFLGLSDFDSSWKEQISCAKISQNSKKIFLIGCEHESVITLGRRAHVEQDILISQESLKSRGVQLRQIERGGEATLHNPGQLVIYPIVSLREYKVGVRQFVEMLQQVSCEVLRHFAVECEVDFANPGVYTPKGKIMFVGIRIDNGVTQHGISINLKNNLTDFQMIRSCGVASAALDRVADWNADVDVMQFYQTWCEIWSQKWFALFI